MANISSPIRVNGSDLRSAVLVGSVIGLAVGVSRWLTDYFLGLRFEFSPESAGPRLLELFIVTFGVILLYVFAVLLRKLNGARDSAGFFSLPLIVLVVLSVGILSGEHESGLTRELAQSVLTLLAITTGSFWLRHRSRTSNI